MPHRHWTADRGLADSRLPRRATRIRFLAQCSPSSPARLDWYDFDANPEVTLGGAGDAAATRITQTVIPAPATFRGMPAVRFWEFEDARVDFGSVDAGPTDFIRMLLVEFALA
jgi:hypothetical protein